MFANEALVMFANFGAKVRHVLAQWQQKWSGDLVNVFMWVASAEIVLAVHSMFNEQHQLGRATRGEQCVL